MCSIVRKMRIDDPDEDGLALEKADKANQDIRDLTKRLELSKMQVLILIAVMQKSMRDRIDLVDIAEYLGMVYLEFLLRMDDIKVLQEKGYLMTDNEEYIYIDKAAVQCIMNNRPVEPMPMVGLETGEVLSRIKDILSRRSKNVLKTKEAVDIMIRMIDQNPNSSLSKGFRKHISKTIHRYEEKMAVFGLVYRYYYQDDDMVHWGDLREFYTEDELQEMSNRYRHKSLQLQMQDIIEPSGTEGVRSRDFFHLRDDIKNDMLSDLGGIRVEESKISSSSKIKASQIVPKTLFYNESEAQQICRLKELMSENRFKEIRGKMKQYGHRTGFTCLFYGKPGTGKTESVYQLARESGRDIYVVEVSQIKSCWVGASEKNIKEVFEEYRTCVSKGGIVPILLFNEADAIFGIRQQGAEKAVDKMENSIQNIILQEMENLDGILIATTNLTQNLDKAFERRFLYKIRFDKPSAETSSKIWLSMLPELSETEALQLSREYDFSGGQIENVVRKKAVNDILGEKATTYTDIRSFCEEETLAGSASRRKIGF